MKLYSSMISRLIVSLALLAGGMVGGQLLLAPPAHAITQTTPGKITLDPAVDDTNNCSQAKSAAQVNSKNCGIVKYIVQITNVLGGMVGVVIVGSIIWGGIQYSAAGSDPQGVAAARKRIRNAIIALVVFIFTYAFVQWLVPGGLF